MSISRGLSFLSSLYPASLYSTDAAWSWNLHSSTVLSRCEEALLVVLVLMQMLQAWDPQPSLA